MRVALIGPEFDENLALRYLAASLESDGHDVTIVPFSGSETEFDTERLLALDAGLIGLSMSFQVMARANVRLARRLREAGYAGHMTAGGHFPTLTYPMLLRDCEALDSVVIGEGESALVDLARCLDRGRPWCEISGVASRTSSGAIELSRRHRSPVSLDDLPFPLRADPPPEQIGVPMAGVVSSRGCNGGCTFCSIRSFRAEAGLASCAVRSPENIADEMERLYKSRGIRLFVFHDDNFLGPSHAENLTRLRALHGEMEKRGIRDVALNIKTRPECVRRDVFSLLKLMGLVRVYIGVESGNDEGLAAYGRNVSLSTIDEALRTVRELGVFACYNVLVFFPDATLQSIRSDIAFMKSHAFLPFNFGRVEVYSGTALECRLRRQGRLSGNYMAWNYRISDPRAELGFRISSVVFRSRNFDLGGVANTLCTLGYEPDLVRMISPAAAVETEAEDVRKLIERINANSLEYLSAIADFVESPRAFEPESVSDFAAEIGSAVGIDDLGFIRSISDLRDHLLASRGLGVKRAIAVR